MPEPRTHLVIGTPCYGGQVASLYTTSLLRLQQACNKRGDLDFSFLLLGGDALITRARQDLVTLFLENKSATHLFFIDGDIAFEPDQVFRLLDFGVDMAAGVYPVKKIDWDKVRALAQSGRLPQEAESLSYVMEFEDPARIAPTNGFAKVRYAGSGFLMIRREALLKMIEKYPDLRYSKEHKSGDHLTGSSYRYALFNCLIDKESGTYLSEDFSFCQRWRDIGGEIWVDLTSRLTHLGSMAFNGNAATQFVVPKPS